MNGMRPYVDFADSKGPLLWLIYGIGYLISPTDYTGVYWISCLVYGITFYAIYRTAQLFVSRRWAMLVSLLMSVSLFYPQVHYEVRCEDFNQLFMSLTVWQVYRLLYGPSSGRRQLCVASLVGGLSIGATLLIKYNVTPMIMFAMLYVLVWSWRNRFGLLRPLAWMFVGLCAVVLPFVVYLVMTGCFQAFIQEYFVNTLVVVGDSHAGMGGVVRRFMEHKVPLGALLLVCAAGVLAFAFGRNRRYRSFAPALFAAVLLLTVTHATWTFHYGTCLLFPVFGLIVVAEKLSSRATWPTKTPVVVVMALLALTTVTAVNWYKHGEALFFKQDVRSADQYRFAAMMSEVKNPRVVYYFTGPYPEYGIQLHSMPGGVYWASQSGSTEEMDQYQRRIAREGQADFFFTLHSSKAGERLEEMGYHRYESTPVPGEPYRLDLFSRRPLQEPPQPWMPRPADILFKRNPFMN